MLTGQEACNEARHGARSDNQMIERGLCHAAFRWAAEKGCGNASRLSRAVLVVFRRIRLIDDHAFPHGANKRMGPMIFWSIVIAVTAISCAALFYSAGGRMVNAAAPQSADPNSHFRQLLAEIDADVASGRIAADQAVLAKKELAREIMRQDKGETKASGELGRGVLAGGVVGVAALALGLY